MNTLERTTSYSKGLPKDQKRLLDRTVSILSTTIKDIAHDRELSHAQGMSDGELMQFIYQKMLETRTRASDRELRRIRKLNEGALKFADRLRELEGTLKAGEVAERLQTTRQTINNKRKANKLLAVRPGNDYLFPVFQFSGKKVVDGFEDILSLLGDDLGAVSKVTFFTGMYFFGEDGPNVIDALRSDHAEKYMEEIKRQAALFGRQVAK